MPRRRKQTSLLDNFIRLVVVFLIVFSSTITAFWRGLTPTLRVVFIAGIVLFVTIGAGLLIAWKRNRDRIRGQAWERAMAAFRQNRSHSRADNESQSVNGLSPEELEQFAVQLFQRMGYRARHTGGSGDHGVDVYMMNPIGEVEIVQCKQTKTPVGEPVVRDFVGTMVGTGAVRGYLLAPGGFTVSACQWAKDKPVILMDDPLIEQMVQNSYGKENDNLLPDSRKRTDWRPRKTGHE